MNQLLKTEVMDCPICGQVHEVGLYMRIATIEIIGVEVEYEQQYYACPNVWPESEEGEFCFGGLWQQNIDRARDAYAMKTNKKGNIPRLAQDFAKDYCSFTPGNRKIIVKNSDGETIWTGKIKDLQHLETDTYWIVTHYLSVKDVPDLGGRLGIVVDCSEVDYSNMAYELD